MHLFPQASGRIRDGGRMLACPLKWLDSFSMRNFTNASVFDDTLPWPRERWRLAPPSRSIHSRKRWKTGFRRKGCLSLDSHLAARANSILFAEVRSGRQRDEVCRAHVCEAVETLPNLVKIVDGLELLTPSGKTGDCEGHGKRPDFHALAWTFKNGRLVAVLQVEVLHESESHAFSSTGKHPCHPLASRY